MFFCERFDGGQQCADIFCRPIGEEHRLRAEPFVGNRAVPLGKDGYIGAEKSLTCGKGINFSPFTEVNRDDFELRGIFLDIADMEELYTVLRNGTPVRVRK